MIKRKAGHEQLEHDDIEEISKSEIKRQMHALQELGKQLSELRPDQLAKVPMSEHMRRAVEESRRISSHIALKRHMQYLGKLLRTEDSEAIQAAVDLFDASTQAHNQRFHALENWRERLITGDNNTVQSFIETYPECDIQHLRQLIRNAQREREQQKPPAHARKLFRYLREMDELEDDTLES
ncbi:ribosome biogenesis factor YjgA [Nitrincola alkalilacustris]|uniref:ribosome biogenesis factor YjgA n=1 Tax=Nitrincola alkalilacustris TaxID=1571224 RepID=UPI00124F623D|nr:ribosome biogenesis factor YjgA [Nitrincola alkalilacustris]